jgi:hypothetical protein
MRALLKGILSSSRGATCSSHGATRKVLITANTAAMYAPSPGLCLSSTYRVTSLIMKRPFP